MSDREAKITSIERRLTAFEKAVEDLLSSTHRTANAAQILGEMAEALREDFDRVKDEIP